MELCQSMDALVLQRQQNHLHRAYLDLGLKKPISEDSVIDSASDDAAFSYVDRRLCEIKWNCDCDCFHGSKIGVDTFDTAVTQQQYDVKRPKLRGKQKKQKETPKLRGKKPIIAADCSNGSKIAAATAYTAKQPCDVKQPKLSAKQKKQIKTPKVRWLKPIDSDCSEDDDDDNDFTTLSSRRNAVDKKKGNRSGLFPDQIRWLTDVERAKYERQVKESGGFDVDCFPGYDAGMIQPVLFSDSEEAWHDCYKSLAILAIENYNYAHQDSKIELSRVVKANFQHDYPGLFYITFEARNAAADNDGAQILNIFQALISSKYGADETVVFCRPKPTPLQSSS